MPILSQEPCLFPSHLFHEPSLESPGRWWVFYTKPNHEKRLARDLLRVGTPYFLPLYERHRGNRFKTLRAHVPLFPRYIFVKGTNDERLAALRTRSVVSCLFVENQEELYGDLFRLHSLIGSGKPLTHEPTLRPGRWVEVIQGPLTGLKGKILRRGTRLKFIVEVQFCQCGVSTELESWMIQPAGGPEIR
jgi:transcription antitermination factor NusG